MQNYIKSCVTFVSHLILLLLMYIHLSWSRLIPGRTFPLSVGTPC